MLWMYYMYKLMGTDIHQRYNGVCTVTGLCSNENELYCYGTLNDTEKYSWIIWTVLLSQNIIGIKTFYKLKG